MSRIQVEEVRFFPLRPPTIAPSIKGGGTWGMGAFVSHMHTQMSKGDEGGYELP